MLISIIFSSHASLACLSWDCLTTFFEVSSLSLSAVGLMQGRRNAGWRCHVFWLNTWQCMVYACAVENPNITMCGLYCTEYFGMRTMHFVWTAPHRWWWHDVPFKQIAHTWLYYLIWGSQGYYTFPLWKTRVEQYQPRTKIKLPKVSSMTLSAHQPTCTWNTKECTVHIHMQAIYQCWMCSLHSYSKTEEH